MPFLRIGAAHVSTNQILRVEDRGDGIAVVFTTRGDRHEARGDEAQTALAFARDNLWAPALKGSVLKDWRPLVTPATETPEETAGITDAGYEISMRDAPPKDAPLDLPPEPTVK